MTAEDWYNQWEFLKKVEWSDLSPEQKHFWERQFDNYLKDLNEDQQGRPGG